MKLLNLIVVLSCLGSMCVRSQDPPPSSIPVTAALEEQPESAGEVTQAIVAALDKLQRVTDLESLKRNLDTVALFTDADLRRVQEQPEALARALAKVRGQVQLELVPKLEAAAAKAGARVQAAQRQVERQLASVQQAIELAQAAPRAATAIPSRTIPSAPLRTAPPAAYHQRLQKIVSRGHGSPGRALVIRTSDTDPKAQANLEEDLAVMSRIFDKTLDQKLSDDHRQRPMGIDVLFAPGSSPIRSLYLEGYGALFLMSVNFPLLPPPETAEPAKEKSETDSAWEEAKREIYGRPDAWSQFGKAFKFNGSPGPEQEYDEKKVDDLKDGLLEAIKNATNIRNLKSDETITVCVIGGASPAHRKMRTVVKPAPEEPQEDGDVVVEWDHDDGVLARGTILTIRVKKSDADAFAKGKLDIDDFRKKASVTTYAGDSSGWGGGAAFGLVAP